MASRQTERTVKKILLLGGAGVLGIVALFFARGTWEIYQTYRSASAMRVDAEHQRDQVVARTAELQKSLQELATPAGVEREIRSRYPVVKPGEVEFVLVDQAPTSTNEKSASKQTLWGWILSIF